MSHQTVNDFVPWTDASSAPSRLSQWWTSKADAVAEGRTEPARVDHEFSTAWPVRALRWTREVVRRVSAHGEGDTREELFAYARKVEAELPNLAAELRFIASHRPDAPD